MNRFRRASFVPWQVFGAVAGIAGLLLVLVGREIKSFPLAWEILVGRETPFGRSSPLAVALSVTGFLLVPTVVGVAAGALVQRITVASLVSSHEMDGVLRDIVKGKDPDQ